MSEYDKDRDPEALEPFYTRHVSAMTAEGLHAKSDIAAELAYRDMQLQSSRLIAEKLAGVIERAIELVPVDNSQGLQTYLKLNLAEYNASRTT